MNRARYVLAWLAAAAMCGQAPDAVFKATTRLVEVDVVVRDKNGPVAGLTKADFTLLDNGKPQEVAVFSVKGSIPFASIPSNAAAKPADAVPLPPGAVSNRVNSEGEARGADTVFLIDQKNTLQADQAFAIGRIVKFIQARRGHDRIAIYSFGRDGFHGIQELTGDQETLNRAAKNLKPEDPVYRTTDTTGSLALLLERVVDTEHALQEVARHLAKVPGRKNLIWITSSFPLRSRDFDYSPQMEQAARSLNDSNIALYAVDARGLIGALAGMTFLPNAESKGSPSGAQRTAIRLGAPRASALSSGFPYRQELSIPAKAVELKLLIGNLASGKIGTLTIPLMDVAGK